MEEECVCVLSSVLACILRMYASCHLFPYTCMQEVEAILLYVEVSINSSV